MPHLTGLLPGLINVDPNQIVVLYDAVNVSFFILFFYFVL